MKTKLVKVRLKDLTRERLISFGKDREKEGAGPVTIGMDIGYVKLVASHAAAVHGVRVRVEPIDLARIALKLLGLIGKGRERDRRPTLNELQWLADLFESNARQIIPSAGSCVSPLRRLCGRKRFAASAGRISTADARTVIVRDRKDPRDKNGMPKKYRCLMRRDSMRWRSWKSRSLLRTKLESLPVQPTTVGDAFRRAYKELGIKDLKFHNLRHEAASRLFEAGFTIEQVALGDRA